jgi:dihydroorotate dehydrogenase electron transfer subunit
MKSFQEKVKIISNARIALCYYRLVLDAPLISGSASPGNFLMVKVAEGHEASGETGPLLRRPLSVHKLGGKASNRVELLYEVVGAGTRILSLKKAGEQVDIIGPLGNGFSVEAQAKKTSIVLVAGGIGVAPLVFLAQRLKGFKVTALIGARTRSQILCAEDLKKLGCDVRIATDDGTYGFRGRVTGLLEKFLAGAADKKHVLYGCGPKPMLKAITDLSRRHGLPAQISLESHMACGIGACLGCVVQTRRGYERVCKEGPVFDAGDLIW